MIKDLIPTTETLLFAVYDDGVFIQGEVQPGQRLTSKWDGLIDGTDEETLATAGGDEGFTTWPPLPEVGEECRRGVYTYGDDIIMVYQDHTRQADWSVDDVPALYGIYHGAGTPIAEWVQPAGGHDAYQTGDQALFNGQTYESLIDNNVWSPATYPAGWRLI